MFSTLAEDASSCENSEYPISSLKILSPLRVNHQRLHKQQVHHVSLTQASRPSTTSDSGAFTSGSKFQVILKGEKMEILYR